MADASLSVFGGKVYGVVTGGGRGIGRAIAVSLSLKLGPGSTIVIVGRNAENLQGTKRKIEAETAGVAVKIISADLGDESTFPVTIREMMSIDVTSDLDNGHDVDHALLINNAASLGDVTRYVRQYDSGSDFEWLQDYLKLNVTSPMLITAHFLRAFPKARAPRRTVVNISSNAALEVLGGCSPYCMGKATRYMLFRTIAVEEPDVRVLSYNPGSVETDMWQAVSTKSVDPALVSLFEKVVKAGKVLKPEQTSSNLIRLLEEDTYDSGAHLDYKYP